MKTTVEFNQNIFTGDNTRRRVVAAPQGDYYHVTFWLSEDIISTTPSKTLKTMKGVEKAAAKWLNA